MGSLAVQRRVQGGKPIPIIQGRLITAISQAGGKLGLLIVDESDREIDGKKLWSGPRTAQNRVARDKMRMAQLEVISACENKGAAMINIRFAYLMANEASEPGLTPANNLAIEFRKGEANAFQMSTGGDSLQQKLKAAGIDTLVVMGYHVNACVRATIGVDKFLQSAIDSDKAYWGAIQYGYRVMTCKQVLHGAEVSDVERDARWNYDPKLLEFYTQL